MPLYNPDFQTLAKATSIASRAVAMTLAIPLVFVSVETNGYYAQGDGGGGNYKRVVAEPAHLGKFQDAAGQWWELTDAIANVRAFGAKGDGVNNDTAAIQSAFNYISEQGAVYAPKGTYRLEDTITNTYTNLWRGVNLYGDSATSTIFDWRGGSNKPVFHFNGTAPGNGWYSKYLCSNFAIYCNSFVGDPYDGVTAIQMGDTPEVQTSGTVNSAFTNLLIRRPGTGILGYYESDEIVIDNCYIDRPRYYGIYNNRGGSNWRIMNCHISDGDAGSCGIRTSWASTTIQGCAIQGLAWLIGIQADGGAKSGENVSVRDCYIECGNAGAAAYGIIFYGIPTGVITNNIFKGLAGASLIRLTQDGGSGNYCDNIALGPNRHTQSAGFIANLVNSDALNTNMVIYGPQTTNGAVDTIIGNFSYMVHDELFEAYSLEIGSGVFKCSPATSRAEFGSNPQPDTPAGHDLGASDRMWNSSYVNQYFIGETPVAAPVAGFGRLFIDSADGDLKVTFANGTTKTITTN